MTIVSDMKKQRKKIAGIGKIACFVNEDGKEIYDVMNKKIAVATRNVRKLSIKREE